MTQPNRPVGCPLFLHRNGQWSRKVKGQAFYFSVDFNAALKRWADEKDHILAGYKPPKKDGKPSMAELANLYLADSRERVKEGRVRADHTSECKTVLELVIGVTGGQAKPDTMTPAQWQPVRVAIATGKSGSRVAQTTLKVRLARCRAFLNWCKKNKHIVSWDAADALAPPEKRLLRLEAASKGKRLWPAEDLRKTIDASPVAFKAVLLMGINCGMGGSDIAGLTRSQWRVGQEYLDCPRNKTGVERRVYLWPETREALARAVEKRATPAMQKFDNRLLLSSRGFPWCRVESSGVVDRVKAQLTLCKRDAGVTKGCFYDLRRTFRTQASEVCDLEAIDFCMGHQGKGEGATYLQGVSDARIRNVCDHVRTWLFSEVTK